MTLVELLAIANKGYPDQATSLAYNPEDGAEPDGAVEACIGDTLALFVVRELRETFDPDADSQAQTIEAIRVIEKAINDLQGVVDAIFMH